MKMDRHPKLTVRKMKLNDIFLKLFRAFGNQHWWPAKTPFEMMTGAILTQNTSWSNVKKALDNFGDRLSPDFVIGAESEELAQIIRPSGFFNQKAKRLKSLSEWYKKYNCDTEKIKAADPVRIRKELLNISGVGRETADSIMLYAFDFPYFVVDAYTRRIFTRLRMNVPDDYDDVRTEVESEIGRDVSLLGEFHALIVRLAKENCMKKPVCETCPLKDICSFPK